MPQDEIPFHASGTPLTDTESPETETFVQEFLRLVNEGWEPELEEFIRRVPEVIRESVFQRLDQKIENATAETWMGGSNPEPPHADEEADGEHSIQVVPIALPQEQESEPEEPELPEQPEESESSDVPKSLGGFPVVDRLGRGTIGEAYLAHRSGETDRLMLKVVDSDVSSKVLTRLLKRAEAAIACGIEGLYAVEETVSHGMQTLLVSSYADGQAIDRVTDEQDFEQRAVTLRGVAYLLAQAHAVDLLHLNLKPNNIIVSESGAVSLVDFALGAAVLGSPAREANLAGLPHFASPEHGTRMSISAKSDVFAFGCVIYRVLTGELPFPGGAAETIEARMDEADPIAPRMHNELIPSVLQDICLACLARNPSDRPDAVELIDEFDRYLDGRPVQLRPVHYQGYLRRRTREVVSEVRTWERRRFATDVEADRVESICRQLLAREEQWTHDASVAPRRLALVGIGAMLFAAGAGLLARFGYAHVSLLAVVLPLAGVAVLAGAAIFASRRGERALSNTLAGGAIGALLPATVLLMQRLGLFNGHVAVIPGISFAQVATAGFLAGAASVALLVMRRDTLFAWLSCGTFVLAYVATLGAFGILGSGAALACAALAPLALLLVVAHRMEQSHRFGWMQPFLWAGLAAVMLVPFFAAFAGLRILGHPALHPLAGSAALMGLFWAPMSALLRGVSSPSLRAAGRVISRAAPALVFGGLGWNAVVSGGGMAWLAALIGSVVLLAHGTLARDRATLVWGFAGALASSVAPAVLGFAPPWPIAMVLASAGLLCAIVVTVTSVQPRSR